MNKASAILFNFGSSTNKALCTLPSTNMKQPSDCKRMLSMSYAPSKLSQCVVWAWSWFPRAVSRHFVFDLKKSFMVLAYTIQKRYLADVSLPIAHSRTKLRTRATNLRTINLLVRGVYTLHLQFSQSSVSFMSQSIVAPLESNDDSRQQPFM